VRKSLLLGGGVVLAGFALVAGLALVLGKPAADYEFLSGFTKVSLDAAEQRRNERLQGAFSAYISRGNSEQVFANAHAELSALGYKMFGSPSDRQVITYIAPGANPVNPKSRAVEVWRDTKMRPDGNAFVQRGWVTVKVIGELPKGFFDKAREWFGL
jgi:hypothetical protein